MIVLKSGAEKIDWEEATTQCCSNCQKEEYTLKNFDVASYIWKGRIRLPVWIGCKNEIVINSFSDPLVQETLSFKAFKTVKSAGHIHPMAWFFMPGGFGALPLRPDALPDTNPPLLWTWDRLSGVLDGTPLRQRNYTLSPAKNVKFLFIGNITRYRKSLLCLN